MNRQKRYRTLNRRLLSGVVLTFMVLGLLAALPAIRPALAANQPEAEDTLILPMYLDTAYSHEERAADLISRMTLAEKASQMISSRAPAIPRLGIREYGWWNEALHGVARLQYNASGNATVLYNTTSYPINHSLASTWDPELMYREAVMISDEAREVVPDNTRLLTFWSPTINMARDPRWGRNDEAFAEDPFLTAKIAGQFVNGMEGRDMDGHLLPEGGGYLKSVTTLKHYAANNSEVNRRNGSSNMDDRTLREYYTAAFKQIVQETDVRSVMTSYNRVNEIPTTASVYLNDNLLRQTFGFTGYITSDCDSIMDISASHRWIPPGWTVAVNQTTRHAFSMTSGVDLNCNAGYQDGQNYGNRVVPAINERIVTETGLFTENDVDVSLLRLFTARMQLGEFDNPDDVPWIREARERLPQGTWANNNNNMAVTQTQERLAMAREVGTKSIVLLKNSETTKKDGSTGKLLPLEIPTSGPFNVAVVGYFSNPTMTNTVVQFLGGYSSNQGTNARPYHVNPYNGIRNAILAINPEATVTYYKGFTNTSTSASGLTTVSAAHVASAAAADLAIVYVGSDSGTANEAGDRSTIVLPGAQASLINQVALANPNTIAVMETIGQMDVSLFEPNVSAMLWSSYNGQRKGEALADVLTGAYNPSGRLPAIWYQSTTQIPNIRDYTLRSSETYPGRTHWYMSDPLAYHFGHGLSYSTFEYSNLQIDKKNLEANDTFQVSVDITNTSSVYGTEVVELYVTTPDASAALERPIKRLRGFQKVDLEPGQTKTVSLSINIFDLAFFDEALGRLVIDNGRYGIQISKSSADTDIQLEDFINVTGSLRPVLSVVTIKPHQQGDELNDIPARVIFQEGKVIVPKVTVAMNDETLYGYIKKNGSQGFPEGMTFNYSSNRNEVVSVDENGIIWSVSEGIATINVDVSYEGVTKSTHFVVVVVNDKPTLSVDTPSQFVQYTDAMNTVTIEATDAAVDMPLSLSTQWSLNGGSFQAGLPAWISLDSADCSTDGVLGTCAWTLDGMPDVKAGTYVVKATVSDGVASSSMDITIVVIQEDAYIMYTGEAIARVGNEMQLRATVFDSAVIDPENDSTIGDITNMWIAFDIFPAQECLSGTPTTLFAQVENTDNGIGTASSQYLSNSEASYCVFTRVVAGQQGGVNEWYAANTDETILTFYENSGQFATGGGWIEDPNGSKGTFGFNGRYLKKDQAKGHMIYIFRGEYQNEMVDYVIKSNAVNALAFSGDEYPISATLQGKGTIQINRSSDGKLLLDMGNATFIATVIDTDNDDPDMFSITVYDRKGVAFKDVQFTELHGGNVVIHTK